MPMEKIDPVASDPDVTATSDPPPGYPTPVDWRDRIGRYRVLKLLGRGGMGSVYLAHDTHIDRQVALKIPLFDVQQADMMERFFREARAAGRLQHPNICPVYDVGEADGVHYLCMAYVEGRPLSEVLRGGKPQEPREAAVLVRKVALALEEAHARGVIHRDLKPSNVMIDRKGEPIVMDFGLAREVNAPAANQTQAGVIMGTPAYMAPEQARGDVAAISPSCDVYSLGVMLYEMLTGRVPFLGHTLEVIAQQLRDEPPTPSAIRPELDARIESICLKAMAKEPSRRFLGMGDFAHALQAYVEGASADPTQALDDSDPAEQAAAEALVMLRTWGWEAGVERFVSGKAWYEDLESTRLLRSWLRGDEKVQALARERFRGMRQYPALAGWALLGRAWIANRYHDFGKAESLLRETAKLGDLRDNVLRGAIDHQLGFWCYQSGRLGEALMRLHAGLDLVGHDHFLTADVLNSMALVYANKNNYQAAHEFIQQALLVHRRFNNDRIVARCHRTLGELYLDWGFLESAEEVLHRGLQRGVKTQDERVQAIMCNYLGRVALGKGQRALEAGKKSLARQELVKAGQWLDAAIRMEQALGRRYSQAAANRDRALVCLAQDDLAGARANAAVAEELFRGAPFEGAATTNTDHEEGLARTWQVQGMIARQQGEHAESQQLLRKALIHFDRIADYLEGTRTQLEIARTLADAGAISQVVTAAYLDALNRAESCRRTHLVRAIEDELRALDHDAHWRHVLGRVRGRSSLSDTSSLADGASEVVSVLFLNLRNFMPFCQGMEPEEVMQTLNHVLADLAEPLGRADAQVTAHLGGGFMALVRGPGHAWRAVDAALELIAVAEEFNRPRAVLGMQQMPVRVAVASGPVCLGNVGTYQKMEFTAIGNAVNLAARLVRQGQDGQPCVSRETRQLVGERFSYETSSPRTLDLGALGRHEVWDVTGRRQGLLSHVRT
jgi:class 3 adenylate cyclase/predicted Ser/Thr protein kinase